MNSHKKKKAAALLILAQSIKNRRKEKKKRVCWTKDWVARRKDLGMFHNLYMELAVEDPHQFRNFVRMTTTQLEFLLTKVGPRISKADTNMRQSISAKERLVVTLRFLATGDNYPSLMYAFRIPICTLSRIIPEVCEALYEELKGEFLKMPSTEEEWQNISNKFEKWNFPHCLGALDGKHVVMQAPKNCGSQYFNYKGTHSIVLLAVADADYKFVYGNFGCNGRVADGGVFGQSSLSSSLEAGSLGIPAPTPLPGRSLATPYVMLADDAFALKPYMMKPYPFRNQPGLVRVFNFRLSRARRVVENAFGIMANRFRVLRKPMLLTPDRVRTVVSATCVLHNFLLRRSPGYYMEVSDKDSADHSIIDGTWRKEGLPKDSLLPLAPIVGHNFALSAKDVREEFKTYFATAEGEVEWQYKFI